MRWLLLILLLPLGAAMQLGSPDLERALLGTPPGSPGGLPGIDDLTGLLDAAAAEDPHAVRKWKTRSPASLQKKKPEEEV